MIAVQDACLSAVQPPLSAVDSRNDIAKYRSAGYVTPVEFETETPMTHSATRMA